MQSLDIKALRRALDRNYVLVLTTNSNERNAVTNCLSPSAKATVGIDNDGARIGVCAGQLVLHVTGTSGSQSDKSVGRITRRILSSDRMPKPNAVVLTGIAWGAPSICNIGDVILSGELLVINQLRFENGAISYVPVQRTSPWLHELADVSAELALNSIPLKVGVLASGEQFYAADEARDALLSTYKQIIGGEMEGWDLFSELQDIPWLQLRGVCDHATTGLTRGFQIVAAEAAAKTLPHVLSAFEERGRLPQMRRDPTTVGLLEVLSGDSMHIADFADDVIFDDHLNYRVGPSLLWRIAQYGLGAPPTVSLPRLLTDLLLEMAQNAIRHGGATAVSLHFGASSVTYSDDGQFFDLFTLAGNPNGRGGRVAFLEVRGHLLPGKYVHIARERQRTATGNKYRFSFPMLSARIRETREKCSVEVGFGGVSALGVSERLSYNSDCETLFYDASELMMSSRRFDSLVCLQEIIDGGRNLIIKCDSERDKAFYEASLIVPDERELTVILAPMALFGGG